jgi:hypothetical protein
MHVTGHMGRLVFAVCCIQLILFGVLGAQSKDEPGISQDGMFIDFDLLSQDPVQLEPPDVSDIVLNAALINIGTETDSYDIFKHQDLPSTWSASFCFGGVCLRPDIDSLSAYITLEPQEKDTISVHIGPYDQIGGGIITLTVRSSSTPGLVRSLELVGITYGTDVLVVDDDGQHEYEGYYKAALGDDITSGVWPRCCAQVTFDELQHFETVIWETGESQPALNLADQTVLAQYLDNGGNLFISGQDIGWALCDQTSPYYSQLSCDFYENYLHASYGINASGDLTLSGVSGDAISHGLSIDISGGDGADNQTSPSVVSPIDPAKSVFLYDESRVGAIRVETETYKVVYFAFGFEAINSESVRRTVMENILYRFAYDGEKGDVDNNGDINVLDVLAAANIILNVLEPTADQHWRADFDHNGQINVLDLIGIVNVILGGG